LVAAAKQGKDALLLGLMVWCARNWPKLSRGSVIHRLVRDMPRRVAMTIIEEIGASRPGMANLTLKAMRRLFAYAIKRDMRDDNPFVGIESYKLGTHHTWTDAEIAAYEAVWPIGTRERLAFDLLLYTGQRVGDVAAMRRSDLSKSAIRVRPEKTGDELVIPLHPNLVRSMKAYPTKGLTLFGQSNGRPISGAGLSSVIERAARVRSSRIAEGSHATSR
jgi:integrase